MQKRGEFAPGFHGFGLEFGGGIAQQLLALMGIAETFGFVHHQVKFGGGVGGGRRGGRGGREFLETIAVIEVECGGGLVEGGGFVHAAQRSRLRPMPYWARAELGSAEATRR